MSGDIPADINHRDGFLKLLGSNTVNLESLSGCATSNVAPMDPSMYGQNFKPEASLCQRVLNQIAELYPPSKPQAPEAPSIDNSSPFNLGSLV